MKFRAGSKSVVFVSHCTNQLEVTFVVKINLTLTPSQNQLASHQSTVVIYLLFVVNLTLTPSQNQLAGHQSTVVIYLLFVVNLTS